MAHDPGLSSATVRLYPNRIEAVLSFSIVDTGEIVEVDRDHDGKFSKDETATAAEELRTVAADGLDLKLNGQMVKPAHVSCAFDASDNSSISLDYTNISFTNLVIRSKWLALMQPGHRQFLSVQGSAGEVLAERMLSANSDSVTIELSPQPDLAHSPAKAESPAVNSAPDFLVMGVKHIWTGYDHLLFLFGLLVVTRNFRSAVKIITCFTIAHSITLAVATLSLVSISSRVVEPLIAASIVYVGIENLIRGDDPKGRWLLTFAFGLIHGFGFASVLKELGVGANGRGIAVPLVSFNLGVEIGQVAIAGLALPVIWKLRTHPVVVRRWVPACSAVVTLLGGYWLIQRIWF
jgi:hydrogenase/urease accessory protein HupE